MAKKVTSKFVWEGKSVSRSTYFRRLRERDKADNVIRSPGDQQRAEIAAQTKGSESAKLMVVRDAVIERERVEAFMLLVRDRVVGGADGESVHIYAPAKLLRAAYNALQAAGYNTY